MYAGALIKKRRYFPKSVPGDLIKRYFTDKEVVIVDILEACTEDIEPLHILLFKEPDYVMNIMVY